jgi:hypothetical protein
LIFNKSLSSGIFPDIWKTAHITPIFKSGCISDVKNYRPISLLCTVSKVLESIVTDCLFETFKSVIIPMQHGFFKSRSTVTNLLNYTEFLQRCMDKQIQVDVIFTDFSKAFDKVSHMRLLYKLKCSGIHGPLLKWLESYLTNRKQIVKLNGFVSREIDVHSGVPQGSHLGPILFSLFINDIKNCLDAEFSLFADDLKIYHRVEAQSDCTKLQENLNSLSKYCVQNKLMLNADKCTVTKFTRNTVNFVNFDYKIDNTTLQNKPVVKDLGVIFDSHLTFADHCEELQNKCLKLLGFILRTCVDFKDPRTIIKLFNSLIRSRLEYCSTIWSPHAKKYKNKK